MRTITLSNNRKPYEEARLKKYAKIEANLIKERRGKDAKVSQCQNGCGRN